MGALSSVARDLAVISPLAREAAPLISAASGIGKTLTSFSDREKEQDRELAELRQKQQANLQDTQEKAALDRAGIAANAETAERKRRDALKRAVARQRAQYGAQGISTNSGGSSEAVLLGLFEESEDERKEREKGDNLRLGAINQNIGAQKRLNVIQRTQLKERQKLERQSSLF